MSEPTGPRGALSKNEPMAKHVTWRAGGVAARAYTPVDRADLAAFLASLPKGEPVCFVGLGSNLLVRDGGYRGTVVLMHNPQAAMRVDGELIYAEAGAASPKVAHFTTTRGFEGSEFFAGIPGTIGVRPHECHCYGSETGTSSRRSHDIPRRSCERSPMDFEIVPARRSAGNETRRGRMVSAAGSGFDGEVAPRERINELLATRIAEQPLNLPNAGSVFRNPPGYHAAQLIEACGLKGSEIGGARISEKHANFIVNPKGRARASDIEALIAHARDTVRARFGVELVPEVRIIGEGA
jgi:UDP-N-acetylmuramate dehydrogenase